MYFIALYVGQLASDAIPPKRKYPMPQTGFVKTGMQEAETARGVQYNISSATATLSIAFHISH
jgi:hypothetical protein